MASSFNPNAAASDDSGIFGLPFSREESRVVLVPVPWDLTTSYKSGTARGPEIILEASKQVDLFDIETGRAYEQGYFMEPVPESLADLNRRLRILADRYRELGGSENSGAESKKLLEELEHGCAEMNAWVYGRSCKALDEGKILGVVGGDHSTPYSAIRAYGEKFNGNFGILHVDAHADLRVGYEGFTYSHASIMYNVMRAPWAPKKLVQVGIRDFCEQEYDLIQSAGSRIRTFFDRQTKRQQMEGNGFAFIADQVASELPEQVYVSFDIDGLEPNLCPHTGTPVPGGLTFDEACELFVALQRAGKKIIGFDLNEVSNAGAAEGDEWDGNVGARILYKLCGWAVQS